MHHWAIVLVHESENAWNFGSHLWYTYHLSCMSCTTPPPSLPSPQFLRVFVVLDLASLSMCRIFAVEFCTRKAWG